jgi:hypothetical protein
MAIRVFGKSRAEPQRIESRAAHNSTGRGIGRPSFATNKWLNRDNRQDYHISTFVGLENIFSNRANPREAGDDREPL